MCKDDDIQKTWSGPKFDELVKKNSTNLFRTTDRLSRLYQVPLTNRFRKRQMLIRTQPLRGRLILRRIQLVPNKSLVTPQCPSLTAITLVSKTDQTPEVKAMHSVASSTNTNGKPSVNLNRRHALSSNMK